MSINKKIKKGLVWSFIDSYGSFVLKFFFTIYIARILAPSDYGLIAMISIFIGVARWIAEGGFLASLVQKKKVNDIDYNTGFYFNLIISLFFFFLYYSAANSIANYYNEPLIIPVIKVYSLLLIFNSLTKTSYIILIKRIEFKKQAIVNYIATILSGIVGVIFALIYKNYWALVAQALVGAFARMVGYYLVVRWIPSFLFSWKSLKQQILFGYPVFFTGLLDSVFRDIYNVIIGKFFSVEILGYFSNGRRFREMFVNQMAVSFNKVYFPVFSELQDSPDLLLKTYYRSYRIVFFVSSIVIIFLILIMKDFVLFFLTEKWLSSVIIIQIFLLDGFFYPLFMLNNNLLIALGKPMKNFHFNIIHKITTITILFVTFNIGIKLIVLGWVISSFIGLIVSELYLNHIGYGEFRKYKNLFPVLVINIFLFLFLFISLNFILPPFWALLIKSISFTVFTIFLLKIFRLNEYNLFSAFVNKLVN